MSKYILILYLIIVVQNTFAIPQPRFSYRIINMSNEDIVINFKTNENLRTIDYFDYHVDGQNISRIASYSNVDLYQEFYEVLIPYNNRMVDGRIYWKYFDLIVIQRAFIFRYIVDENNNILYITCNGIEFPRMNIIMNIELTGKEIFDLLVEDFTIYDLSGNLIMTLEDITEELFTQIETEDYLEEYPDNLEDYFTYPFVYDIYMRAINNRSTFFPYGIFITPEIINEGRNRYQNVRNE